MKLSLPAEKYLPQKGPMQFVHRLESVAGEEVEVSAELAGNLFARSGQLDSLAMVELLAQGCAAFNGYRNDLENKGVREGFLAGITAFQFEDEPLLDRPALVRLREDSCIPPFSIVSGEVLQDGRVFGSGSFKVWEGEGELPKPDISSRSQGVLFPEVLAEEAEKKFGPLSPLEKEILLVGGRFLSEETRAEAFFSFPETFTGFQGHFPDFPVFPGVMMLKTVQLLCSLYQGKRFQVRQLKRVKFGQPVFPGEEVCFQLTSRDEWQTVSFEITGNGQKRASGRMTGESHA